MRLVVVRSADVGTGNARSCAVRGHRELGGRQLRSDRQATTTAVVLS